MMEKLKRIIPNILTSMRLVVIPFIILLGIYDKYKFLAIVGIIVALTDYFDGKLARKWNVCTEFGARLDAGCDKLLAMSLLIVLILKNKIFIYLLVLEGVISIINLIVFSKSRVTKSILIGKFKTWLLYITVIMGVINLFYPKINTLTIVAVYITLFFQIITAVLYFRNLIDEFSQKKKTPIEKLKEEHYNIIKDIVEHEEFQKRKTYAHHYNESVYEHCYRVSFDAFCIAKKHNWDYQSAAIAGILHDFYYKPWQDNIKKGPLLQKHGFVHAHEALLNSRKFFNNHLNDVIENSIERHMFPLNKIPPKYKIGWLIVFVDKTDSLDFLIHPSVFMKCFINKDVSKKNKK